MKQQRTQGVPTVSHRSPDGTLVELLYNPTDRATAFAVRHADGSISQEASYDLATGERLVPYSPGNNLIASGCVVLPSTPGDVGDDGDLVREVQAFLHRYVDLSPLFEEIAAYYVLLTWVFDAFEELPYLRVRGDYGTGKTRTLMVLGSLCHKAFFASGASTVSPIFHVLDAFRGTLILDEADFRFSDTTAELTKILNQGTCDGLPVLRTMSNRHKELSPTAFRVYGPKIIAMREHFADRALESRFLTEEAGGRTLRKNIPISLPASFKTEAQALRNRLLAWRFKMRGTVGPKPARLIDGVEPRVNQTALALLSLIEEPSLRARLETHLRRTGARTLAERSATTEATMLAALLASMDASEKPWVTVSDITERFNAASGQERPVSNRWVGGFLRSRLRLGTQKSNGVYVMPQSEWERARALATRHGVGIAMA